MRGEDQKQAAMYSYVTLAQRIPADHPARTIRQTVDRALARMDAELEQLYSTTGRPSIAPERLLRASLLMVLYSIRSERQLMERMNYNLLYRWFVGLEMDDPVWDVTVFTKNRERLIAGEASQRLLESVLVEAREHDLLSEEHFTVDGTLIQAWAAARSFVDKSDPPAPGSGSGHNGEVLLRDKVESKADPDARLYKKASADKAVPGYQGHALIHPSDEDLSLGTPVMENRNGLVVAAEASLAATIAEREAALKMLDRVVAPREKRNLEQKITLGADTQYQEETFIEELREREVAPHVSEYVKGNLGKNSLTAEERHDPRRTISQRKRKLIERVFGWSKLDHPLRQVKLRGLKRVDWFYRLSRFLHLALLISIAFSGVPLDAASSPDPLLHKQAPIFVRNDLNHQRIDLAAYRGHVVLLTFWATWCAPCQIEMPHFVEWQSRYGADGLQIIGVSMDDDSPPVLALTRKRKVNYPIVMGDEKLGTLYGGILGLPVTYLIDRNGTISAKFKGAKSLDSMESKIKILLSQKQSKDPGK